MNLKNWLSQKIKNENWFSHGVMFITTILGILIALELDKNREEADKAQKLNQYRTRLDNELKINKGYLIGMKEWLQHDYVLLEMEDYLTQENSTGQVFEIPEPQDTSKLSQKIREF